MTLDGTGDFDNHFRDDATAATRLSDWTPDTGAHEVFGVIGTKSAALGWNAARSATRPAANGHPRRHRPVRGVPARPRGLAPVHRRLRLPAPGDRSTTATRRSAGATSATRSPTSPARPTVAGSMRTSAIWRVATPAASAGTRRPERTRSTVWFASAGPNWAGSEAISGTRPAPSGPGRNDPAAGRSSSSAGRCVSIRSAEPMQIRCCGTGTWCSAICPAGSP